jgi:hypothetical protein
MVLTVSSAEKSRVSPDDTVNTDINITFETVTFALDANDFRRDRTVAFSTIAEAGAP